MTQKPDLGGRRDNVNSWALMLHQSTQWPSTVACVWGKNGPNARRFVEVEEGSRTGGLHVWLQANLMPHFCRERDLRGGSTSGAAKALHQVAGDLKLSTSMTRVLRSRGTVTAQSSKPTSARSRPSLRTVSVK